MWLLLACNPPDKSDDELLGYGVPAERLKDVRQATEDSLLILADRLPSEASEALLELATGGKPRVPQPAVAPTNPFDHPDAQRRFRVMTNVEKPIGAHAPMGQFVRMREYPNAQYRDVTAPNADTLYTTAWFDPVSYTHLTLPTNREV